MASSTPNEEADELSVAERLMRLSEAVSALPLLDDRSDDEIVGYDEHGLPQ